MTATLRGLDSFGKGAAEDEPVLTYFFKTEAVARIAKSEILLVLGRKGSGKTALVRHFSENTAGVFSRSLSLRGYPWALHGTRVDRGASPIEAYVSSWRYLIAVELAALVSTRAVTQSDPVLKAIKEFLTQNYGGPDPSLDQVLRPPKLRISKGVVEPTVLGNKIGSVALERSAADTTFGLEVNALTDALLSAVATVATQEGMDTLSLHFDELDQGMSTLDAERARMLIGLILAARLVRQSGASNRPVIAPVVYLRSDIWEDLEFSDKNKVARGLTLGLEWTPETLRALLDERIKRKVGPFTWDDVASPDLMRGSQSKWSHIVARTFVRPRDVVEFANVALKEAQKRSDEPLVFINEDIVSARDKYSAYLKEELDDEIIPHWPQWDEALKACSAIQTLTFERDKFVLEYERRKSGDNVLSAGDALRMLYRFSVIGYEKRSGYGGSSWSFQYTNPEAGWDDGAQKFKVHQGLKEYAKLSEERKDAR
jgi:hypothetical protein